MLFHLRVSSTVFPYIHDFFQHDKSNLLPNNTCTYKKERKSSPPCCFNNQSLVLLIFPFLSAEFFINGWMEFSENFKDDREYKYLKKFILHFFKINFWSFVSYSETKKPCLHEISKTVKTWASKLCGVIDLCTFVRRCVKTILFDSS